MRDRDGHAILSRLGRPDFFLGKRIFAEKSLEQQAWRVAEILAGCEPGCAILWALMRGARGTALAGRLDILKIKLQAGHYIQYRPAEETDLHSPARRAWHAASAQLCGQVLDVWQNEALFNWAQHIRRPDDIYLQSMQAALHKFKKKTIHRTGAADSVRHSLMRIVGKRQGALRAATLGSRKPAGAPALHGVEKIREVVRGMIMNLHHTSMIRLTDGHVYGLSSKQLSRSVANLLALSGTPFAAHLNLSTSKTRESNIEFSRGPEGIRIFIGTTRKYAQRISLGATVGFEIHTPGLHGRIGAAGSVTPLHNEMVKPEGLVFRIARRPSEDGGSFDDKAMYEKAIALVDHLFSDAEPESHCRPEDTWRLLAQSFYREPDLSVGWLGGKSVYRAGSAKVSAGATTDVVHSTVGPEVSAEITGIYKAGQIIGETGRRTVKEIIMRSGYSGEFALGLGFRYRGGWVDGHFDLFPDTPATVGPVHSAPPRQDVTGAPGRDTGWVPTPLSRLNLTMSTLTVPVYTSVHNHNRTGKLHLTSEDGGLVAPACFFDVEYKSLAEWEAALRSQLPDWVEAFAMHETMTRRDSGIRPMTTLSSRQAALRMLGEYVESVRKNERDFDSYYLRYQLRDAVALRINANKALMQIDPGPATDVLAQQNEALLRDPASWVEAELKVKQFSAQFTSSGLDFGAKAQRKRSLWAEREWSYLKVTPAALQARQRQRSGAIAV